ncbi:endonuclease dU [Methanosarcina mazei]|uniref:UPF0215 protein MM_1007 n=8 Tax=Methanosarcina mazei TaxID=2209 RepID=Y1007_METMA|nr:DUF99 family protein [Methanosarcina mazei]Q8PY57.1 RecName: Full=UPF0215 protein MM_1007 [Methanosarcina mazei Go1]AAM30703.1 conserved protein [Methanosarcina mazei Go1]AGF96429.1 Hypothetical protein MmTuc01_1033 [Methanosarcina mazei Tuc01]AKB39293.1 hypothetical protein MSMAW_0302 [Methanosarcina mazei WWM610]AKB60281.1 hypothetical protein MSMAP_0296 [Methanosarcina mazei SarPi]AKB63489.1 hypothetical protein MSMAS_0293 [Methanosarcina mazei S-6]
MDSDFHVKPEIRILGIDDSALLNEKVMIVGTVFRGGDWIDGVLRSEITRDGLDATEVMVTMIKNSRHHNQLRVIMLDGITYGGFNVVDIEELYRETGLPVIVIMRSCPDFEKIRSALKHFSDGEERWKIIKKAGKIEKLITGRNGTPIYIQKAGIGAKNVEKIIRLTSIRSSIPEPLRVAHLIATGITLGESRGKA